MVEPQENDLLSIHVNIHISPHALQAIVGHAKRLAKHCAQGIVPIDTADFVSAMISRFLAEKDFESYAKDESNYAPSPNISPDG